jgi:hypothetical protein
MTTPESFAATPASNDQFEGAIRASMQDCLPGEKSNGADILNIGSGLPPRYVRDAIS